MWADLHDLVRRHGQAIRLASKDGQASRNLWEAYEVAAASPAKKAKPASRGCAVLSLFARDLKWASELA
jgi:hypothetical protein